jgi:hypothetical protein
MTLDDLGNEETRYLFESLMVFMCAKTDAPTDINDHFHMLLGLVENDPNRNPDASTTIHLVLTPANIEALLAAFTQLAAHYGGILNIRAGQQANVLRKTQDGDDCDLNGPVGDYLRSL